MGKKLTLEEALLEFVNRNLIPLFNIYKNSKEKLLSKTQEGYLIEPSLNNLKNNHISNIVSKYNIYAIQNIKLWCKLNNKHFELIDGQDYTDNSEKLKWKCLNKNCNEIFEMTWNDIQSGHKCGFCHGQQVGLSNCLATKNPELAKEWHPILNGDLTPFDVTIGSSQDVWWICNKGHVWEMKVCTRTGIKCNCPYCAGKYPSEDYNLLVINPELCEEWNYNRNNKRPNEYTPFSGVFAWWKCKECGHEWEAEIKNRNKENGTGCPECNKSKGEKECKLVFDLRNVHCISQKTFKGLVGLGNGLLSYDFYLPQYNLLIEYQGEQHERHIRGFHKSIEAFEKQVEHDRRKREYAEENKIKLLEIWYYDFDNIENILSKYLQLG